MATKSTPAVDLVAPTRASAGNLATKTTIPVVLRDPSAAASIECDEIRRPAEQWGCCEGLGVPFCQPPVPTNTSRAVFRQNSARPPD